MNNRIADLIDSSGTPRRDPDYPAHLRLIGARSCILGPDIPTDLFYSSADQLNQAPLTSWNALTSHFADLVDRWSKLPGVACAAVVVVLGPDAPHFTIYTSLRSVWSRLHPFADARPLNSTADPRVVQVIDQIEEIAQRL